MIKIAHEAPLGCFKEVQEHTDYDYFLVHLFDKIPQYLELALKAKEQGRETILDNSIFELGEAFNMERFAVRVNDVRPTYYIVPDALENSEKTMNNMQEWLDKYKDKIDPSCKMIGVVQGKDYGDICKCYTFMNEQAKVDKIAIPFDFSYYKWSFVHPSSLVSWAFGRIKLLGDMLREGIINTQKKHHLLGCGLAEEFAFYDGFNYSWIDSVDTSNPVLAGIEGHCYEPGVALTDKSTTKMCDLIMGNQKFTEEQTRLVVHNVQEFRNICCSHRYIRKF